MNCLRTNHLRMNPWRIVAPLAFLALALAAGPVAAQAPVFTPSDEKPEDYPGGPGRDDTFYACTPCHGFKVVAAQGQSRRQWDDTLDWMTEKHNMPKPRDAERKAHSQRDADRTHQ